MTSNAFNMFRLQSPLRARAYLLAVALTVCLCSIPRTVFAQVAITVGVEELYDDNIFLEDDGGLPPLPEGTPPLTPEELEELAQAPFEQIDGSPDDDTITHPFIEFSGSRPLGRVAQGTFDLQLGAFFFSEFDKEDRLTVDSLLRAESLPEFIPQPYFIGVESAIVSESNDITVASGTVARQSQSHRGTVSGGIRSYPLFAQTDASLSYSFTRHDFLGEWTFDSQEGLEEEGSDWNEHGLDGTLTRHMSERLDLSLLANVKHLYFTHVENQGTVRTSKDDLERVDSNDGIGFRYRFSRTLEASGQVTADISHHVNDPEPRIITTVNPDGSVVETSSDPDTNEVSLGYRGQLDYAPTPGTALNLIAEQTSGTDIDGRRITTRTFSANAWQLLGERFELTGGGRYVLFDAGDAISNDSDRWETNVSLRYAITESISLAGGWSYVKQDADEQDDIFILRSDDYEGNRAFISISAGLVGTRS